MCSELAYRYMRIAEPYLLVAGTVEGLREASKAGLMVRGAPICIEDFRPSSLDGGSGRQSEEEYLVNLFGCREATTVDARNSPLSFQALTSKMFSANRPPAEFIAKLLSYPLALQLALQKRIVFFELTELVVTQEKREEHAQGLDMLVADGRRRADELRGAAPSRTASSCWVCGSAAHVTEGCFFYSAQMERSREDARSVFNLLARSGCTFVLEEPSFRLLHCPGDGDCFFHAVMLELSRVKGRAVANCLGRCETFCFGSKANFNGQNFPE